MHLLYESLILLSLVLFRGSLSFNVVGYMPEWRHEGADFDRLCQHLTHLIFFSLEMTPKGEKVNNHNNNLGLGHEYFFQETLSLRTEYLDLS